MNKNPKTLEEKIKLSEELVDKYLDEASGVDVANAVSMGINTATGLGRDAAALASWAKKKWQEKKRQRLLAKQEKEKKQL